MLFLWKKKNTSHEIIVQLTWLVDESSMYCKAYLWRKIKKDLESRSNSSRDIINEKYYRVENIDELQQILNETTSSNALVNTKEVNKEIKSTFKKRFMTFYSKSKSYSSDECDKEIEQRMQEINDTLEAMTSNDATKERKRQSWVEEEEGKQCTTSCWSLCMNLYCQQCESFKRTHIDCVDKHEKCVIDHCLYHDKNYNQSRLRRENAFCIEMWNEKQQGKE